MLVVRPTAVGLFLAGQMGCTGDQGVVGGCDTYYFSSFDQATWWSLDPGSHFTLMDELGTIVALFPEEEDWPFNVFLCSTAQDEGGIDAPLDSDTEIYLTRRSDVEMYRGPYNCLFQDLGGECNPDSVVHIGLEDNVTEPGSTYGQSIVTCGDASLNTWIQPAADTEDGFGFSFEGRASFTIAEVEPDCRPYDLWLHLSFTRG